MSWFSVTEFQQYIDDLKIEVLQATDVNKLIDCIKRLNQKKNSYSKSDDSNNEMVIKGRASIFEKEIIARIDLFKQRTSVISALDNYIDEVQSLRIQKHFIDNTSYLDISEYDQHKLTYQPFLAKLQDKALTEILNGSSEQINNQLKRLQHIHERFQRFYSTLKDKPFLYKNLIYIDFVIHLSHIFRIDQLEEGILPYEFIHHLRDAVMHKQGSVYYLINQINAVITPETQHNISTTRRDDVNDSICKVPFIPAVIGSNFNISENILDAYYRLVPQPRSRKDISDSYIGKLHHYNAPFRVSVYGAYPLMIDWEDIEYKMKNFNDKTGYYKAYTRDNVFNAMKDFAKGFQFGFDNFLKEKVNTSLSLSNSESMKVQKVLDFLSSPLNKGGFSESSGSDKGPFEKWYDCGVKAGYLYFAWYLIIENHKLFEPFFSKNQAETTTEIIDSKIKIPDIPPIIPSTIDSLPPIEKVFFVHYQCDKFEEGDLITSLCVYDNIDIKVFQGDETKAIEAYCQKVNQLCDKKLIPIHWGQNSPHFGVDHIKERYKILTGKEISLQYPGSLNLSDYLIFKHGENYVPHRRLDNLALLNNFSGVYETENSKKTFPRDRILLLSKIYLSELQGNLKIASSIQSSPMQNNSSLDEIDQQNDIKEENNKMENTSKTILNNIFPSNLQSSLNPVQRKIGLILFQFNAYFTLESITMTMPSKNIPREIYRKEVDDFSDFDLIFKREFNKIKESGHPILPILFLNLEIKKFKKWITDYESLTEDNLSEIFTPVYPDGYRRAINYLEYLSNLRISGQFDFLYNQSDDSNDDDLCLPTSESTIDKETLTRLKESIAARMEKFKGEFQSITDFNKVCLELQYYFENKTSNFTKPFFIKKGNKLKLGRELGEFFQEFKNISISLDYLLFLKRLFTIYQDENIDDRKINYTNLYKYLTNKS